MKTIVGLFLCFAGFTFDGCQQAVPDEINSTVLSSEIRRNIIHNDETSANETPPIFSVNVTKTILWEGDSRSRFGNGELADPPRKLAELEAVNYVDYDNPVINISKPSSQIKIVNIALSGDTLQAIRKNELSQPDRFVEGAQKIYILDAGGNDIGGAGRTARQTFDDYQYIAKAQAAKGYTVYAATICDARVSLAIRAQLTAFNKLIRANYPANRIIDFARVSRLNDFASPVYFLSDGIHYTSSGKMIKAQTAQAVLKPEFKPAEK